MKKDCSYCKHLYREGYEDYCYVCNVFGDDIPDWAQHPNCDCCLLKEQELKKMEKLQNDFLIVGSGKELDEFGFPEWTDEDAKHNEKAKKNYDSYIEVLMARCEDRKR